MTDLAPFVPVTDLEDTLPSPVDRDRSTLAVTRASGAIRGHCHWSISTEVVTGWVVNQRTLSRSFWLPTLWLVSVDSIVEDGVTLTAHTDYEWDASGRVVRASGSWSPYMGGLVVGFTHGYPDGDHRLAVVQDVCLAAAARMVTNPSRHSSETTGNEAWVAGVAQSDQSLTDGERDQLAHLVVWK